MKIEPHENCQKCQLFQGCKTPYMQSHGAKDPLVLIAGEAPGEEEDTKGMPFVGRSGQLLRQVLEEIGFDEDDVRFTNVVRCRPPDNKISKRYINYCKHYVEDEIAHYKPELVLLMGNSPLGAILGESGITTWNGVVVEREDTTYVPLFHPAYVLRNMPAIGDWLAGFERALDTIGKDAEDNNWEYLFPSTIYEVKQMQAHLAKYDYISYDVENVRLDPHAPDNVLLAVSFAAGGKAYAVPCNHKESPWSFDYDNIGPLVEQVICDIIKSHDGYLIGHNIKYDLQQTRKMLSTDFQAGGDTMIVSHLLDSRQGIHSLKRLAGLHLGMYDYDRELQEYVEANQEANYKYGGDYGAIPLSILLPYAAKDAEATIRLHDKLYPKLSEKQKILYDQLLLQVSDTLADMEYNGIPVDHYIAERYKLIYSMRQEEVYEDIESDKHVLKMVTTNGNGYRFNPNSSQQVAKLLHNKKYYNIPVQATTPTGNPSTSTAALKGISDDYEIIKKIRYYKLLTKMIGTYLEPACGKWIGGDGRVHSTYNLHGTRTGRLCVAKGTMIEIVRDVSKYPNGIPIENVKVGDLAYTYNYDGSLTLRKVKWVGKTGHKKVVRVYWLGQGMQHRGYVDLTPEHEVLLTTNEWVRACDLRYGDRVMAVSRSTRSGYSGLYITGNNVVRDHRFIMDTLYGVNDDQHVHHIDGNKLNNIIDNLQIMDAAEHCRYHALERIESDPSWPWRSSQELDKDKVQAWKDAISATTTGVHKLDIDKDWLQCVLWECAGRPAVVAEKHNLDYGTVINRCDYFDIDWRFINSMHNRKNQRLTKEFVKESICIGKSQGQAAGQKFIGLGYYRWRNIQEHYEFKPYNHMIIGIRYLNNAVDVYDIEVEDTHNFIANEICVHNSSRNPNLQNIPTPEKEPGTLLEILPIKNVFTHSFKNGVLMSVDYSGMELRVFASMAKCHPMIDIHKSGQDFHSTVAIMAMTGKQVHQVTRDEIAQLPKSVRYVYKWTNWTLLYGGGAGTLISLYGMSPEEANHTVDTYYSTFPEVLDYRQQCEDFAYDNGYIESPFGRREYLAYISDRQDSPKKAADKRAAVNMPIQSGASDTLLCALVIIHANMKELGLKSLLVNTVHDSIVIDCHPDEIDIVAELCTDVMENIVRYAAEYLPGVDFSWLICPLKADVEIGTHYGTEVDYEQYKSGLVKIH